MVFSSSMTSYEVFNTRVVIKLLEAAIKSRRGWISDAEAEIHRFEERIKDIKEGK